MEDANAVCMEEIVSDIELIPVEGNLEPSPSGRQLAIANEGN